MSNIKSIVMNSLLVLSVLTIVFGQTSDPPNRDNQVRNFCDGSFDAARAKFFGLGVHSDIPVYIPYHEGRKTTSIGSTSGCRPLDDNPNYVLCDDPNWTKIDRLAFPDILCYLKVNATHITNFDADSFVNKTITNLDIADHGNITFHEDAFRGLIYIEQIRILNNVWIVKDDPDYSFFHPFRYMENLRYLSLESNKLNLRGIDVDAKTNETFLHNLQNISLEGNDIKRLEGYIFWNLRSSPVKILNLRSCNLRSLSYDTFRYLPNLEDVDFYGNPFLMIPGVHHYMPKALLAINDANFFSLGLGATNLISIPYLSAQSVRKNLKRLNLSNNLIPKLGYFSSLFPDGAALNLTNLEEFIAADNLINEIHRDVFASCKKLRKLNLKGNMIRSFWYGMMVESLEELDLSSQCENAQGFDTCNSEEFLIENNKFINMSNLKKLDLNGLKAGELTNMTFNGLENLEFLKLSSTRLNKSLPNTVFAPMKNLKTLDLSLNADLVGLKIETFDGLTNLETLDMTGSSKILNDKSIELRAKNPNRYLKEAIGLPNLRNLVLECALVPDCKGDLDYEPPLSEDLLKMMPNLEVLDLSKNSISSWTQDNFLHNKKLQLLDLSHNSIVFISDPMLELFKKLKTLDLSDNRVICDSGVTKFYDMSQEYPELEIVNWSDGLGYFCTKQEDLGKKIPFREWAMEDKKLKPWEIGAIVGSLAVFLTVVMIGSVIYVQRYYIAYAVLKSRKRLKQTRDENVDFDFDVFICYSHDQHQWVRDELLPQLEEESPSVKACLHERDFEIGVAVMENIVRCVDKSRKFMMILSKEFQKSKWCMFETDLARARILTEDNPMRPEKQLIVVVREMPDNLKSSIRDILSTWTYLPWLSGIRHHADFYRRLKASILRT